MTPDEINRTIADVLKCDAADFYHDANAARRAVCSLRWPLTQTTWQFYMYFLRNIVSRDMPISQSAIGFDYEIAVATPAQQSEAFLRAHNRWPTPAFLNPY